MIGDNGCGLGLVNSPKINVLAHIDPRSPWRGRQQSISSLFLIIDLHILHVAMVYSSLILRVCCINSRAMCSLFSRCSPPHDHFHTLFYFPTSLMPSVWLSCWLLWRARSPLGEMMSQFVGQPSDLTCVSYKDQVMVCSRWCWVPEGICVTAAWLTTWEWHASGMTRHYYSWNTDQENVFSLQCKVHKSNSWILNCFV